MNARMLPPGLTLSSRTQLKSFISLHVFFTVLAGLCGAVHNSEIIRVLGLNVKIFLASATGQWCECRPEQNLEFKYRVRYEKVALLFALLDVGPTFHMF